MIVPAFTAAGAPAWTTPAAQADRAARPTTTGPSTRGRAATSPLLAGRLQLFQAGPDLGTADRRVRARSPTRRRCPFGARLSPGPSPAGTVPPAVAADVAATHGAARRRRPSGARPARPWPGRGRPTRRTRPDRAGGTSCTPTIGCVPTAGLGTAAGDRQPGAARDREAGRLAGAYEEATDRLRRLSLGLLASRSLWKRRVPADPVAPARRCSGPPCATCSPRPGPVTDGDGARRAGAGVAACSRRPPSGRCVSAGRATPRRQRNPRQPGRGRRPAGSPPRHRRAASGATPRHCTPTRSPAHPTGCPSTTPSSRRAPDVEPAACHHDAARRGPRPPRSRP